MQRFSAVWWISGFLKIAAIYIVISGTFFALYTTTLPTLLNTFDQIVRNLVEGAALLAISEILRLNSISATYSQGFYAAMRKRSKQAQEQQPTQTYHHTPATPQQHVFIPPLFEETNLPTIPISQSYRPQTVQRAPMRRVTVFRNRAEHEVRPPRPAGTIEVIESLDDGEAVPKPMRRQEPEETYLPFDKI